MSPALTYERVPCCPGCGVPVAPPEEVRGIFADLLKEHGTILPESRERFERYRDEMLRSGLCFQCAKAAAALPPVPELPSQGGWAEHAAPLVPERDS